MCGGGGGALDLDLHGKGFNICSLGYRNVNT